MGLPPIIGVPILGSRLSPYKSSRVLMGEMGKEKRWPFMGLFVGWPPRSSLTEKVTSATLGILPPLQCGPAVKDAAVWEPGVSRAHGFGGHVLPARVRHTIKGARGLGVL